MADKPFDLSNVRNRIVERRMMKPSELLDHPGQWRDHTQAQAEAMVGVLSEIGITDTLKAWVSERAGGQLVTWDGHLRKSLDPDVEWPVDVTDLTDAEADYALVTHDPLGAMARTGREQLDALLSTVLSGDAAVQQMLSDLAANVGLYLDNLPSPTGTLAEPPENFKEYDDGIATDYCCPKCGYEWSGKPK